MSLLFVVLISFLESILYLEPVLEQLIIRLSVSIFSPELFSHIQVPAKSTPAPFMLFINWPRSDLFLYLF